MTNVPVGPATIVGYIFSALAAGGTVIAAAEHELSGTGKWLAILSAITAITTNLGRQLQATGVSTNEAPSLEAYSAAPEASAWSHETNTDTN